MNRNILAIGIIILFILSALAPITFGSNVDNPKVQQAIENYKFDRYLYPEYYGCYNSDETTDFIELANNDISTYYESSEVEVINPQSPIKSLVGPPMDSAWPMHGHDVRHTGLSPYSTADNLGEEKWWFFQEGPFFEGSPVVDNDGVIYFGSWDNHLYALYPNGTMKWKCYTGGNVETSPAIAEDGTIYVGTHFAPGYGTYLYAINPNGTWKWRRKTGNMYSSPAIGDDGTIYCSDGGIYIIALYPNGTLKWEYRTGASVLSSPAIGDDGTVYCGSHDNNIYALYPNNGTVKWKYTTGNWVHGIPTIGDDGTIYCGSDDLYMYALYPNNGSMKWRCYIGSVWGSPALDKDGNLYVGVWEKIFYSIYPDGTIRWRVNLSRRVWGQSAVVSDDGTIYFGTCDFEGHDGGHLHALNPDGSIKYILYHTRMFWSSPAIGADGTVYICTRKDRFRNPGLRATGYLRALGKLDPNAPSRPSIDGVKKIILDFPYEFKINTTSPLGRDIYLWVEWGDGSFYEWIGPYASGEEVTLAHRWPFSRGRDFTIRVKAKDSENLWGPWGEFDVSLFPRNKEAYISLFLWFLERFPLLERLINIFGWNVV